MRRWGPLLLGSVAVVELAVAFWQARDWRIVFVGFGTTGWIILSAIAFLAALWFVPKWQVAGAGLEPKDRIETENTLRATLAQILAGSFFLLTAYSTWKEIESASENIKLGRQNLELAQRGQITDRFTKAIEQMGAGKTEELPKRLGGIYSLERIGRDSADTPEAVRDPKFAEDYGPVMEVLTAFVRENAPWPLMEAAPKKEAARKAITRGNPNNTRASELPHPRADVQAALTVLGRRKLYGDREREPLDLSGTDLRRAHLERAHLERAYLMQAHLEHAGLDKAYLQGALMTEVHLEEAHLRSAHLEGANLSGAYLTGATYTKETVWPAGIDPQKRGAKLTR